MACQYILLDFTSRGSGYVEGAYGLRRWTCELSLGDLLVVLLLRLGGARVWSRGLYSGLWRNRLLPHLDIGMLAGVSMI